MKYEALEIQDVILMTPNHFGDDRGAFMETFRQNEFMKHCGSFSFVQDNVSISNANVLRGLHTQKCYLQGKLVQVLQGRIFDVVVDLRKDSKTFGKWLSVEMSSEDNKLLWIPPGLGHGFYSYDDNTIVTYKCTDYYRPQYEQVLMWNDPSLAIEWPEMDLGKLKVSDKDKQGESFSRIINKI